MSAGKSLSPGIGSGIGSDSDEGAEEVPDEEEEELEESWFEGVVVVVFTDSLEFPLMSVVFEGEVELRAEGSVVVTSFVVLVLVVVFKSGIGGSS